MELIIDGLLQGIQGSFRYGVILVGVSELGVYFNSCFLGEERLVGQLDFQDVADHEDLADAGGGEVEAIEGGFRVGFVLEYLLEVDLVLS
jgi:hypothetical protein